MASTSAQFGIALSGGALPRRASWPSGAIHPALFAHPARRFCGPPKASFRSRRSSYSCGSRHPSSLLLLRQINTLLESSKTGISCAPSLDRGPCGVQFHTGRACMKRAILHGRNGKAPAARVPATRAHHSRESVSAFATDNSACSSASSARMPRQLPASKITSIFCAIGRVARPSGSLYRFSPPF